MVRLHSVRVTPLSGGPLIHHQSPVGLYAWVRSAISLSAESTRGSIKDGFGHPEGPVRQIPRERKAVSDDRNAWVERRLNGYEGGISIVVWLVRNAIGILIHLATESVLNVRAESIN